MTDLQRVAALAGRPVPHASVCRIDGTITDLADVVPPRAVLVFYPATGIPGRDPAIDPAPGWDDIPGAAGCTPQNRGFRERAADFQRAGIGIVGISTQPFDEQREFAQRERIPYPLLSDRSLELTRALDLPTFTIEGRVFLRRLVADVTDGVIGRVFFPIDDPAKNAEDVYRALVSAEA